MAASVALLAPHGLLNLPARHSRRGGDRAGALPSCRALLDALPLPGALLDALPLPAALQAALLSSSSPGAVCCLMLAALLLRKGTSPGLCPWLCRQHVQLGGGGGTKACPHPCPRPLPCSISGRAGLNSSVG